MIIANLARYTGTIRIALRPASVFHVERKEKGWAEGAFRQGRYVIHPSQMLNQLHGDSSAGSSKSQTEVRQPPKRE